MDGTNITQRVSEELKLSHGSPPALPREEDSGVLPDSVERQETCGTKRANAHSSTKTSPWPKQVKQPSTTYQMHPPPQTTLSHGTMATSDEVSSKKVDAMAENDPGGSAGDEIAVEDEQTAAQRATGKQRAELQPGTELQPALDTGSKFLAAEPLADALLRIFEKGIPAGRASRKQKDTRICLYAMGQPSGPGIWIFSNPEACRSAIDCFGNEPAFKTEGIEHPSASEIARTRQSTQYHLNRGVLQKLMPPWWEYKDLTLDIGLSWVEGSTVGESAAVRGSECIADTNALSLPPGTHDFGFDEVSHLQHAPMNFEENDQRGVFGEAKYCTVDINGKVVTLDRSNAVVGKPFQRHKTWIYKGRWEQYPAADGLDWTSKHALDNLNKWRNQTLERDGWPMIRVQERKQYTTEQRTYLFNVIAKAGGKKPDGGYQTVADDFNKTFRLTGDDTRNKSGITTVCRRLIDEYAANDGKEKPKKKRPAAKRVKMGGGEDQNVFAGNGKEDDEESEKEDGGGVELGSELESEYGNDENLDAPIMDKFLGEFGGESDNDEEGLEQETEEQDLYD